MAFGDGRNTLFLCELNLSVSGVEITKGIVQQTVERLRSLGQAADLRVGRNNLIPFESGTFKCVLASHCIYYCDEGTVLRDNLREYSRVLQPKGWLVASVACKKSYIFKNAEAQPDGSFIIRGDPYGNRNGYRLFAFDTKEQIEEYFSEFFTEFSFGSAANNYFGVDEKVFWVVCKKKENYEKQY
jgi:SAM-dependent methyltransferase